MEATKLKGIIYDDVNSDLLFLEDNTVVFRTEYLNSNNVFVQFGKYELKEDGTGKITEYLCNDKLGFFKNGKPFYNLAGLLKLGNMHIHIAGKRVFENTIIKYLTGRSKKVMYVVLNNNIYDTDVFFLKYLNRTNITRILWHLNRNNIVTIKLELHAGKINYDIVHYGQADSSGISFITSKFLAEYDNMGLETAPVPSTKEELDKLLDPIKEDSLDRKNRVSFDDTIRLPLDSIWMSPKLVKRLFNTNQTTNIELIGAYKQFLKLIFSIEKYDGISIRVPKDFNEEWFRLLPCCTHHKIDTIYNINNNTRIEDLCINLKKLATDGDYICDINGVGDKHMFSDDDKILEISVNELQTSLYNIFSEPMELYDNTQHKMVYRQPITSTSTYPEDQSLEGDSINMGLHTINNFDMLTSTDVLDADELKVLATIYSKHILTVSIRTKDDMDKLNVSYGNVFAEHIAKGILYPNLRFKFNYGYRLNEDYRLHYCITSSEAYAFEYMLTNRPMNIHMDILAKYNIFINTQIDMFITIDDVLGMDALQVENCKTIYKEMFKKYIDLGVLKPDLVLTPTANNLYIFSNTYMIFTDEYLYQVKPIRKYDIFLRLVDIHYASNSAISLDSVEYVTGLYKEMFKSHIKANLMYDTIVLNTMYKTIPSLDHQWLK